MRRLVLAILLTATLAALPLTGQSYAPGKPPAPPPPVVPPEAEHLVDLAEFLPDLVLDIRYARPDNFTNEVLYAVPRALCARGTAEKLAAAKAALGEQGFRLIIWDAYRPVSVQQKMWDLIKDPRYVGDPSKGTARHARACAIDLTLADQDGRPLEMPTGFDDFSPRASADWPGHAPSIRARALALRRAMLDAGFTYNPSEWWHFSDKEWDSYPVLDLPLDVPVPHS